MKNKSRSKSGQHKETNFDPKKIFTPEILQTNLLLSSLYLTTYEILKTAIIEGVKDFFIVQTPMTDDEEKELLKSADPTLVTRFRESYQQEVEEYEREVGIKLDERDKFGLIPSCIWLHRREALSEAEVEEIKKIRDHRNEIAHELPMLLLGKGFDIHLEHFQRIRSLIHKIDVFWARNDVLFDPYTLDEVNISDMHDDEIFSVRYTMVNHITNTVVEYLNKIVQNKSSE